MNFESSKTELLFTYGSLKLGVMQNELYGRHLEGGIPDAVIGYKMAKIPIATPQQMANIKKDFYPIIEKTANPKNKVFGLLFYLSEAELLITDFYEGESYHRVKETLQSGIGAWVYVR